MPFDQIPSAAAIMNAMSVEKRLTPSDVHVDRPLTNISVAYLQDASSFVADSIFPRVGVQKQSDMYYTYDRSYWTRSEMRPRPPSTETPGASYMVSTDNYMCDVYGLHTDIDHRVVANADSPLAPRAESAEFLTRQGLLFREIKWTMEHFTSGVWTGDQTGTAAAPGANSFLQWNDAASDPVGDVMRWKSMMHLRSGGFWPNTMVISREVYDVLRQNDSIIDRTKYGQTPGSVAMVTRQTLAALFEIDRIFILDAIHNTAVEGATEALEYIAGKNVALYYVAPRPGLRTPSAGYTFVWNGYIGASDGQRITTFDMPNIRSERIEIELAYDHKVVGADLGIFAEDAIA